MRFTMARPEVSCHPESLLDGRADGRLGGALLLRAGPRAGRGRRPHAALRLARPLCRSSASASTHSAGGSAAPYRVLVDANHHVDRAGAERAGVGFIGKNTMLITRTHGSWVVLGTLVTDVELEATPPLTPDAAAARSASTPARRTRWTSRASSIRRDALRTGRRHPGRCPSDVMDALEDRVYGCDICQDVCPWNRGVEKRRAGAELAGRRAADRLARRLADRGDGATSSTSSSGSTSRGTRPAGCGGTRSSRSATSATRATRCSRALPDDPEPALARGRAGARGRAHVGDAGDGDARAAPRPRPRAPEPRGGARSARRCARKGSRPRRTTAARRARGSRARDIERLVSDPELVSLRLEPVDVGALAARARLGAGVDGPGRRQRLGPSGDPTRLRQALGNLVANGLRHGTLVVVDVTEERRARRDRRVGRRAGGRRGARSVRRGLGTAGSTGYGLWLAARSPRRTAARWSSPGTGAGRALQARPAVRFRRALSPSSAWSDLCARRRQRAASWSARARRSRRGRRAPRRAATPRS